MKKASEKKRRSNVYSVSVKKKGVSAGKIIVFCVLTILIIAICVIEIALLTNGFNGSVPLYSIEYEGKTYYNKAAESIGPVPNGAEFTVNHPFGEYDVKIEANELDLEFKINEETLNWKDLKGRDLTSGFKITKTDKTFKIEYETAQTVLSYVLNGTVTIDDSKELFELVVTCNEYEYRLDFSAGTTTVKGVTLNPERIKF